MRETAALVIDVRSGESGQSVMRRVGRMTGHRRISARSSSLLRISEKDWLYTVEMNRWFLKPIGAWPFSLCASPIEKIRSVLLALISCFLIGFLMVPCALRAILDKGGDLNVKIKLISPLTFFVMAAVKYCILVSRGAEIGNCVLHVKRDWDQMVLTRMAGDREIMLETAKSGRSLAIVSAVFMYSGGFFFTAAMPLIAKKTELVGNETVRAQTFPIYRGLMDPRNSPFFEIVQLTQCLAAYVVYSVTLSVCSLAAVFAMHACGQFKVLAVKLDDLVDGFRTNGNDSTENRLRDVVEHHLRIIGCKLITLSIATTFSFINRVEQLLQGICLGEFMGCTLNICCLGYQFLMELEHNRTLGAVTYCTLLVSFTFNIFILCYIGEILSEECKQIGVVTYMIDWYRLPGKKALDLTLIQAISNYSIKLTAGKFIDLSLTSFCSVLKSAMAYFSLLRTLSA